MRRDTLFSNPAENNRKRDNETVRKNVAQKNHMDFLSMLSGATVSPALLPYRKEVEKNQSKLKSQAERIRLVLTTPGLEPQKLNEVIPEYMGKITENNEIRSGDNENEFREFGQSVIGGLQKVFSPEIVEDLRNTLDNFTDEDPRYTLLSKIANGTGGGPGRGSGLELPLSEDPKDFADAVRNHRYLYKDNTVGTIRVSTGLVRKDLEALNTLPDNDDKSENEAVQKYRSFLENLLGVDIVDYFENVQLPELRKNLKPRSLRQAEGATRLLILLLSGALGTVALLRKNMTSAAFYLGLAALVKNPTMLTDGPLEHMTKQLGFTIDKSGQPDRWAALMEGPYASEFTGTKGVQMFEILFTPSVQKAYPQYKDGSMSKDAFYEIVEESGADDRQIQAFKTLETEQNAIFTYVVGNTARVKGSNAQDLLYHFVQNAMTGDALRNAFPGTTPFVPTPKVEPDTGLGGLSNIDLDRDSSKI